MASPMARPPSSLRALPVDALLLQLPQDQGPALPVHGDRTGTGPDRSTVDIDHSAVGLAVVAAIQFIQCQRAPRLRGMTTTPVLSQFACALDSCRNLAQADVLTQQGPQTSLDAPRACVARDQQGQDRSLHGASWRGFLGGGRKRGFQCRQPLGFPAGAGLASTADLLTQATDESRGAIVGEQRADPLCIVLDCARMSLDQWFLLGVMVMHCLTHTSQGAFWQRWLLTLSHPFPFF